MLSQGFLGGRLQGLEFDVVLAEPNFEVAQSFQQLFLRESVALPTSGGCSSHALRAIPDAIDARRFSITLDLPLLALDT